MNPRSDLVLDPVVTPGVLSAKLWIAVAAVAINRASAAGINCWDLSSAVAVALLITWSWLIWWKVAVPDCAVTPMKTAS